MNNRRIYAVATSVGLTLALAACATPPPASRAPVTSFPAQSTAPSGPTPGGGGSGGASESPNPSASSGQSGKPTPKPTPVRRGPTHFSPGMVVGLKNTPERLRDLPLLPKGAGVYQGPDSDPPYADEYGILVTVQIPDGADYIAETDKYVDAMLRQAWTVRTFYPAHEAIPDQQYILTRGAWTATVTGREYKGNKVITVSVILDGFIE
mgnify:CR=1 FL=1